MKTFLLTSIMLASALAATAAQTAGTPAPAKPAGHIEQLAGLHPQGLPQVTLRNGMRAPSPARTSVEEMPIVYDLPDGLADTDYSAAMVSFALNGQGMLMYGPDHGHIAQGCIDRDGGKVYIHDVFSGFPIGSYIVGDIVGDEAVFTFPQKVRVETWMDWDVENQQEVPVTDTYLAYKTIYSNDGTTSSMEIDEADPTVRFAIEGDNLRQLDDSYIALMGIMHLQDPETLELKPMFGFTGFAVSSLVYTVMEGRLNEAPATAEFDRWVMQTPDNAWLVDVAIDGEDFYLKGYSAGMSYVGNLEGMLKGNITEGQVSFPSRQYVGIDYVSDHWAWFFGSTYKPTATPDGGTENMYYSADALVFDYNPDTHILSPAANSAISISSIPNGFWLLDCLDDPELKWQDNVSPMTPANPTMNKYDYWEEYGYGAIDFDMPPVSTDGRMLNTDNYFFTVLIDGETVTFYPDEYVFLLEPMTEVPYNYFDPYFVSYGINHAVVIYPTGIETIGVRCCYYNPDGSVTWSEASILDLANVDALQADAVAVECFDAAGRRVAYNAKGLKIRRTNYSDGSVKVEKILDK